jgi:hypothetical protein
LETFVTKKKTAFFSVQILLHKFGFKGCKILEVIFISVDLQNEGKGAFGEAVIMTGSRIEILELVFKGD